MINCPLAGAAQEAVIIADQAVIYSTMEMTGPLGYISRGKRVQVGEIPRHQAQLYPIIISGRVAYIQGKDLSFKLDGVETLSSSRFYDFNQKTNHTHYSLGFINFSSQYKSPLTGLEQELTWYGFQLKGEVVDQSRWGLQLFTSGMWSDVGEEQYRSLELAVGASYLILELNRFKVNVFAQMLGIPFASYAVGSKFRVNGAGYGLGLGSSARWDIARKWGVEASLGIYQMSLSGFDAPEGFTSPAPSFSGARSVLSAYYRF